MKGVTSSEPLRRMGRREMILHREWLMRQGLLKLLWIKDSDIRILTVEQNGDAVDKGLHAGGALSATIPLVALFYGGFLKLDIEDPTRRGQDMFTLSKGHAVAALASIYADLGYFDRSVLKNSRSYESILNGHPGPILPGVQIATGPMGQGIGVAQGFAIAGRSEPRFDSYCMVGDGELQEGSVWEAAMYAGQHHLDNLCVLVDRNHGQLDLHSKTIYPMPNFSAVFQSFGWESWDVDATQYDGVVEALERFRFGPRTGKPTAIVCQATKGYGGFSDFLNKHKVTTPEALIAQELELQKDRRQARIEEALEFIEDLGPEPEGMKLRELLLEAADRMHLEIDFPAGGQASVTSVMGPVLTRRVPRRDKTILYHAELLPRIDPTKWYSAATIVGEGMKVFARDRRVLSIDSDLGVHQRSGSRRGGSGPEAGAECRRSGSEHDADRGGVCGAGKQCVGEHLLSIFQLAGTAPHRCWAAGAPGGHGGEDGWLSEGHGLDLTFLATAANFETRTNGATHMGNDDNTTFDAVGQLKIIDVSCPQQLLSIMKWIMAGNRGLVYVRVMRTESAVLYSSDYEFAFGKGHRLRASEGDEAVIVSSGRGVHEALAGAQVCSARGVEVGVVDMPSIDEELLMELCASGKLVLFAEQNNGYLWQNFLKVVYRHRETATPESLKRVVNINTLNAQGKPQFIHSATYEQLTAAFGLTPEAIADAVESGIASLRGRT